VSTTCDSTNDSANNYHQEFETIWGELYNPEDRDCPVSAAIRHTAWRRRPNYIGLGDFKKALYGRMYQKLKANFLNKRKAGMSAEEWRQEIGKLTKTANSAAGEEVHALKGRSKSEPIVYQLDDRDLSAFPESGSVVDREFLSQWDDALDTAGREYRDLSAFPESGSVVDREFLSQWDHALDTAGREPLPTHMSDDAGKPMLRFLRGELRTRDTWEHFQVCEDCQEALRIIYTQLIDFVVGASSRAISKRHVSVITKLKLRTGAIQFLLRCRGTTGWSQASRDRLAENLGALDYRRPLQHLGRHSVPRSPRRMQLCDKFLMMLAVTSTLLVFLIWGDEFGPFRRLGPVILMPPEFTPSGAFALHSLSSLVPKMYQTACRFWFRWTLLKF